MLRGIRHKLLTGGAAALVQPVTSTAPLRTTFSLLQLIQLQPLLFLQYHDAYVFFYTAHTIFHNRAWRTAMLYAVSSCQVDKADGTSKCRAIG